MFEFCVVKMHILSCLFCFTGKAFYSKFGHWIINTLLSAAFPLNFSFLEIFIFVRLKWVYYFICRVNFLGGYRIIAMFHFEHLISICIILDANFDFISPKLSWEYFGEELLTSTSSCLCGWRFSTSDANVDLTSDWLNHKAAYFAT